MAGPTKCQRTRVPHEIDKETHRHKNNTIKYVIQYKVHPFGIDKDGSVSILIFPLELYECKRIDENKTLKKVEKYE